MAEELNEAKKAVILLDGKEVTVEQLEEAKKNTAVRIIEDKDNPGQYRTLTKMQG